MSSNDISRSVLDETKQIRTVDERSILSNTSDIPSTPLTIPNNITISTTISSSSSTISINEFEKCEIKSTCPLFSPISLEKKVRI